MVMVRVNRITSVTDPNTGQPGRRIEFVELKRGARMPPSGEMDLVRNVIDQLQSVGLFPPMLREVGMPKLIVFLSENEYDMLGLRLEVNDVYELVIKDGCFRLKKPEGA